MNELNANLETRTLNNQTNSQSDNSSLNKNEPAPKSKVDATNKPKSLADLFGDPSDESSTEINLDDNTPDDPNAPIDSIDRLIKRNKLTPEQAYAIKVPMPNGGESLTIGQLKDKISELNDFELRATEFDERRIKQEGELLKSQSELRSLLSMLPKESIKPEVLQKLRDREGEVVRRENQLTLEHIPQWRDEKTRTAEFEGIVEMLSDYGFDASFLGTVIDHRARKFLRDTYLMRSRIKKSLESVRDPKKIGQKPSGKMKPATKPSNIPSRKTMQTQDDKLRTFFESKE